MLAMEDKKEESQIPEREQKPPSICVNRVLNINPLSKMLKDEVPGNFYMKTLRGDKVKIQPKTAEAFKIIVSQLDQRKTEFYTFKPKSERSFKVVLKNIHPSTDVDEIKAELLDRRHKVSNRYNIKHREIKLPLPLFIVEIEQNNNNKHIYSIKGLLNNRVVFEPPRPKKEVPQCGNCQQYGHMKSCCRRKPKCIKCAGDHASIDCDRKGRTPDVKCVLCGGNHTANYKGCMVYKSIQQQKYPNVRHDKSAGELNV